MASQIRRAAILVASCSALMGSAMTAPAAAASSAGAQAPASISVSATTLGNKIADQALSQYTSTNTEVKKRRYEGAANGVNAKNNCNFYTGFWTDPRNRRFDGTSASRTGTNGATCGTSKGYMYVNGTKTWTGVKWKSRAWCADFAKYTWYWGGAKVTGLNAGARSFKAYGQTNRTWHTRAQVASGAYVPKKGDVVSYDWQRDGVIDHVGVITTYSVTNRAYFSVEGNSSDRLTYKNTKQSAISTSVVGYTSPKAL